MIAAAQTASAAPRIDEFTSLQPLALPFHGAI